ncbi:hypothetical protein QJS66_07060 [Kocuria rhizophila]|nr:hypothetical protein QJS66_07060 [Kocuria rhizophila]
MRIADQLATAALGPALGGGPARGGPRVDASGTARTPAPGSHAACSVLAPRPGAKVVGGGFGGSVIALAREDELDELAASWRSAFSDRPGLREFRS